MHNVTLRKISRATGISISAISQVLNNHPHAQRFRPETREKIRSVVREMGYQRNENAAYIRSGICKTVALITDFSSDLLGFANQKILSSFMLTASNYGFTNKIYDVLQLEHALGEIIGYKIEYLVVFTQDVVAVETITQFAEQHEIKLCFLLQCNTSGRYPLVYTDDRNAIRQAVEYLFEKGHRRIAYLSSLDDTGYLQPRLQGYLDGLASCKLLVNDQLISNDPQGQLCLSPDLRPTGFICADDRWAMKLEHSAIRMKIQIPEECAIIGFGDVLAKDLLIPVTSIRQDFEAIGRLGLLTVIGKPDLIYEHDPGRFLLPAKLIEREST